MATIAPYGSWKSAITTDQFVAGNCKSICEFQLAGPHVFWVEQNLITGKREVYSKKLTMAMEHGEQQWIPSYTILSSIHEYGGNAIHTPNETTFIFSTKDGVYKKDLNGIGEDKLIDSKGNKLRFSDFSSNATHLFCVNEDHIAGQPNEPVNQIVAINFSTKELKVVASGADFYAYPRVSPNGNRLVWMEWNRPNMPWDETSICVADLDDEGGALNYRVLFSGVDKTINYSEPSWIDEDTINLISDESGFWNVYKYHIRRQAMYNLNPIDREIGYPLWQLGFRNYAYNARSNAMIVGDRLHMRKDDEIHEIPTPGYTVFSHISIFNDYIVCIASGPKRSSSIIVVRLSNPSYPMHVIREARAANDIEKLDISTPEEICFESDGVDVYGHFYPPKNSQYAAPAGTLPPVLLIGHGGPTAIAQNCLDMKKQFFTSRGIAVFDVNYRGSTGFGREFRRSLYENYGIADRNDILNGAKTLIEQGRVDENKILMMGSSSGGFLLLSCLISPENVIKAAVSHYGVADLQALDEDTHKFEKCYNQILLGKDAEVYRQRNPINHIEKINVPVAFTHGKDDTVVPMQQSVSMYEKLRNRGITTALMLFDGEGHGYRNGNVVKESTEAAFYFLTTSVGIQPSITSKIQIVNPLPGQN
ncbi:unnamed protein product [Caenorhabditis bovis]|uniref:Peptidase S9 prolyl oligopeptidase catalytic domain-containing protein n=1 Tax=Caenorhabditis bovis TaxID=2654633 RepID=A0A8S1EJT8_9PELO|nr:unnamed protein product [Caenorhabditis bovis]